jgi:hypothetical protein
LTPTTSAQFYASCCPDDLDAAVRVAFDVMALAREHARNRRLAGDAAGAHAAGVLAVMLQDLGNAVLGITRGGVMTDG